jgi:hypothetical protein
MGGDFLLDGQLENETCDKSITAKICSYFKVVQMWEARVPEAVNTKVNDTICVVTRKIYVA